jgi:hypothetical protein
MGVAVAEIEGLYTALLKTASPERGRQLRAELACSAERLAALAAVPERRPGTSRARSRRSRRERRKALAERGAAWIIARYGRNAH